MPKLNAAGVGTGPDRGTRVATVGVQVAAALASSRPTEAATATQRAAITSARTFGLHLRHRLGSIVDPTLWHGSPVTTSDDPRLDRLDPRDRAYAEELDGDEREIVVSSVARYRHPDRLAAGDALPDLAAARLEDGTSVALGDLARDRPLLLVFGSFT